MAAEIAGGCQDSSMTKLWKVISPGKKAAASGSDAAHAAAPRIDDAMRAAVATAAQRANERVAQQAGECAEPGHGEASLVAAAVQRAVEKATAAMTGR